MMTTRSSDTQTQTSSQDTQPGWLPHTLSGRTHHSGPRSPCHPPASSPSHRLASAAFHLDHTAAVPPPTSSWALTMGNNVAEVRDRLLAAWVVWGARLRRGPGAPLTRRGVSPTLTKRGEARTAARFINSTHLLVPSPVQRRSGRLPPRPPGPPRVLELCLSTASALAAPFRGVA